MQRETFSELRERSLKTLEKYGVPSFDKLKPFIEDEINTLVEEEKAIELTDDEMRMLKAYRSSTKEAFSWRRPEPEGIVLPVEPTLLVDPREV